LKSKTILLITISAALILIAVTAGCNYKDQHIGVYEAVESGGKTSKEKIIIELKEKSIGAWRRSDEEVAFSWSVNKDELRINTRDGGTMVGKIKKKGITMILPGEEEILFKKVR
jgi:hypothetical protein